MTTAAASRACCFKQLAHLQELVVDLLDACTSMPASALAVAMPEPMRPPPSTAIFFIFRGFRPASVMPFTYRRGAIA